MSLAYEPIPEFPAVVGEEGAVDFTKDGAQYRILRLDGDRLVIHRIGRTATQFQIFIHSFSADGEIFDVEGIGENVSVSAMGADRGILRKLF
jgi:hypothetical protein